MKTIIALASITILLVLSYSRRYPCSELGCPNVTFADGDLCLACRAWLKKCEPLTPVDVHKIVRPA
jgi:hypothetical protein